MAKKIIDNFRDFPSVEELLQHPKLKKPISSVPRQLASQIVKDCIASFKSKIKTNEITEQKLIDEITKQIDEYKLDEITKVINATGIVIHTNLGRAPLSESLFDEIKKTVVGYGNIEFDIKKGSRGNRGSACERYLTILSGAEASTVVNNCAAALFIILNSLSNRRNVIISRSELVQIGGGFRIPDILKKSGAKLVEIGTTNITSLKDYEDAIDEKTGLILKVHQSNFIQKGFAQQVNIKQLSTLATKYNIPLVNDLGSGVFIPTKKVLGYSEPTVQQSVRDGADITCFSGDKMLGGGQAGLIVGKTEYIKKLKQNPLFRTFRVDKIVFSMLEKLLSTYLNNTWQHEIKLWKILSVSESELYKRGKILLKNLGQPSGISVEATKAYIGGGALPESDIPSVAVVFSKPFNATTLFKKFKNMPQPIIGRIEDDRFYLDLKAIEQTDLNYLEKSIKKVI
jgi:L-seryl-tRNA(Ser) seleniumtransferase